MLKYLCKFLLDVGVDIDVVHTVRHFPRLFLSGRRGEPSGADGGGRSNSGKQRPQPVTFVTSDVSFAKEPALRADSF